MLLAGMRLHRVTSTFWWVGSSGSLLLWLCQKPMAPPCPTPPPPSLSTTPWLSPPLFNPTPPPLPSHLPFYYLQHKPWDVFWFQMFAHFPFPFWNDFPIRIPHYLSTSYLLSRFSFSSQPSSLCNLLFFVFTALTALAVSLELHVWQAALFNASQHP